MRTANFSTVIGRPSCVLSLCILLVCSQCGPMGNGNTNANDNADTNDNSNVNGDANINDNSAGDNINQNGAGALIVIDTGLDAHPQSPIRASDRVIAFRSNETGEFVNRLYEVDSDNVFDINANDTTFTDDFVVSGTSAILRGANNGVYHYDSESGASRVSPGVRLNDEQFGSLATDGGNIVAFITSEPFVCWIDLSNSFLFIRTFGQFPTNGDFYHVAVDGSLIAFFDDTSQIEVRDTSGRQAAQIFDVDADVSIPLDMKDGYVVYADSAATLHFIDLESGENTDTQTRVDGELRTRAGRVCGFRNGDANDQQGENFPSLFGSADGTALDVAPREDNSQRLDAGWGASCAISVDGSLAVIAGAGPPEGLESDLLSLRDGSAIELAFEGDFTPVSMAFPEMVSASNVHATADLVGMLLATGQAESVHLGYVQFSD